MRMNLLITLTLLFPLFACAKYSYNYVGDLDTSVLNEVSGMQCSQDIKDRFYFINDSGDDSRLYYSDGAVGEVMSIKLSNTSFIDTEDMGLLKNGCGKKDCLIIADIGNNDFSRDVLSLYFVKEQKDFNTVVSPYHVLNIRYPKSRRFNAEAIAIEPKTKDLFLLTKKAQEGDVEGISALYRLKHSKLFSKKIEILELVEEIDFRHHLENTSSKERVTSMDFSQDEKLAILTTKKILFAEYRIKKNRDLKLDKLQALDAPALKKQESFTFSRRSKTFYYTTESKKSDAPIYQGLKK